MYRFIQKTIDWGVKIASLAVTGPATWQISGELFKDIQTPAILVIMRLAAVFLVEGVLISNWLLLEFDKQANELVKARYGITALAMYAAMLVIAWQHEGPVGLVFRGALLAALIGSGWDTYANTWQRMTASVDRSPENSGKVKRTMRELAIKEAIHKRQGEHMVTIARQDAEVKVALKDVELYEGRLLANVRVEDKAERVKIATKDREVSETEQKSSFPHPIEAAREQLREQTTQTDEQLREQIAKAFSDNPKYPRVRLANDLGIGTTKLYDLIGEMRDDGRIVYDEAGRSYLVAQSTAINNSGNGNGNH